MEKILENTTIAHWEKEFFFVRETSYSCGGVENTVAEYQHQKTGMQFIKIPGGSLTISGNRELIVKPFLIARYPVTQGIWRMVMKRNPSYILGVDRPVEKVHWLQCREFCEKTDLHLPTEIQWEYACRAGTDSHYYWGDEIDVDYVWFKGNSNRSTQPVIKKKPNAFGLYDMLGNVHELCIGCYGLYGGKEIDAYGKTSRLGCAGRGGAWNSFAEDCRVNSRECTIKTASNIGFRPCRNLD